SGERVQHRGELRLEKRHIDLLPLIGRVAMSEGREYRNCAVQACANIGNRYAYTSRARAGLSVTRAGHRHDARHGLHQVVVARASGVRSGLSETRQRTIDQARIDLLQLLVAQSILLKRSRTIVLDQHVRTCCQLPYELRTFAFRIVDGNRALVPVDGLEICRFRIVLCTVGVAYPRRTDTPTIITPIRALYFHHVRA